MQVQRFEEENDNDNDKDLYQKFWRKEMITTIVIWYEGCQKKNHGQTCFHYNDSMMDDETTPRRRIRRENMLYFFLRWAHNPIYLSILIYFYFIFSLLCLDAFYYFDHYYYYYSYYSYYYHLFRDLLHGAAQHEQIMNMIGRSKRTIRVCWLIHLTRLNWQKKISFDFNILSVLPIRTLRW